MAATPRPKTWARSEYERLVEAGIFGPEDRLELIDGEIIQMSPEKSRHAAAIDLALEALRRAFGPGVTVRVQHPLALSDSSEPEPDLAVVRGSARDYVSEHPHSALLVVEVSDSSLDHDRGRKSAVYARAGIPEYWIVNLVDTQLEVYREPSASGYSTRSVSGRDGSIAPLAAPHSAILVADLLP